MKRVLKIIGWSFGILLLFFMSLVFFPLSDIKYPYQAYNNILIENIHVVDVENDTILRNHRVFISGDIIKLISDKPITSINKDVKIIKGDEQYLTPALWDMHAHLLKQSEISAYPEYVINGVMYLREMRGSHNSNAPFSSTPERIKRWNKKVKAKKMLGPKVFNIPSFAVDGSKKRYDGFPEFFNCSNEEQAKQLVSYFKEQGVDMIKIYNDIPQKAFYELAKEAKNKEMTIAGHKPVRISTIEASKAGMKSLEHARFLLWDSFKGTKEMRNSENPKKMDNTELRQKMLAEHDTLLLNENLNAMRMHKTFYCPTHLTRKADAYADDIVFRARYDSVNPLIRLISFEDLDETLKEDTTKLGRQVYKKFYEKGLEITKTANIKGVKILAGSDVPELPGSSLLDELEELSKTGLSNYEVLKTATVNPSEYFNVQDKVGSIKVGKKADLIFVTENPVEDIQNLRKIGGLIRNGIYINSDEIKKIKHKIYSRNKSITMSAKLIYDVFTLMLS